VNWSMHLNLWNVAAENLWRHRRKTIAIFVPLMLAVTAFSAMSFIRDGMLKDALLATEILPDITVQAMIGGRAERLSVELGEHILKMKNVARAAPRVWGYAPVRIGGDIFTYTLMGIDSGKMPGPGKIGLTIAHGRFLDTNDLDCAVIGKAVADHFHVAVGDGLDFGDELGNRGNFKIVGLFADDVQIYAADLIIVPIRTARKFFGYSDNEATDLCVYLSDPSDTDAVCADIRSSIKGSRVLDKKSVGDTAKQVYGSRAGVFQLMWIILLLAAMLTAWTEASSANLHITHEIGVLKATGWSTMNVIEMKVFENVIIAGTATMGGMLLGLLYLLAGAPGIKEYFLGWAVIYPDMKIPVHVCADTVGLILAIGFFPLLVATIIPAWAAGTIDPDEAIRG